MDPIRIMVSRYTCGFAKVKIAAIEIVGIRPFDFDASISIVVSALKTAVNLRIPYPDNQRAEKPKRVLDIWLMILFKKNDIPATPILMSNASASAQNKAT